MNALKDIIWAILEHKMKLPRLIKAVYLVDWKCAISGSSRPCGLNWVYGPCGPTDEQIFTCVKSVPELFSVEENEVKSGDSTCIITTITRTTIEYAPVLSDDVTRAINHVLKVAMPKKWEDLSILVSSTYPIMKSSMFDNLDIDRFSKEYRDVLRRLGLNPE